MLPRQDGLPGLLVLASTYPRWAGDPEPGFVHELSKRLAGQFEVTVLCPHHPGAATDEVMEGVRVVRYRYAPGRLETLVSNGGIVANLRRDAWKFLLLPGFLLGQWWAARGLVRTTRPAVIHAHWLVPQGLVAATVGWGGGPRPPFLVTSHGADLFALRGGLFRQLKRFVLARAAAVTVVSRAMLPEVRSLAPDAEPAVEPMGVDLVGRFHPDAAVERSRTEVLFVGRLVEKKGVRHLIEAWPRVVERRPDAVLTIVGFGPLEDSLKARCTELGLEAGVHFTGARSQSELPGLYRRAAVFVAPFVPGRDGDQEGLGLVVVEAIGCGCPVVIGDVPAVHDVVGSAGASMIVRSSDPGALADAILASLTGNSVDPSMVGQFDWARRSEAYGRRLASIITGAD